MKEWSVEIYLLDPSGKRLPAKCFTKVVYNLHPSFENPTQSTSRRKLALRAGMRGRSPRLTWTTDMNDDNSFP